MNVALYARVSTRDREQTTENQLIVLRRWAADAGHTVLAEYTDEASSTRWNERAGWARLIAEFEVGQFHAHPRVQVLAVARLDRAFRSVRDAYNQIAWLTERDVRFIAVQQPTLNTVTPEGRFMLAILAAMAEFELDLIRARTRDGLERAKAEGKLLGRPTGAKDKGTRRTVGYRGNQNAKKRKVRKPPTVKTRV